MGARLTSARATTRAGVRAVRNRLDRRRYARTVLRIEDVPEQAVVVFFAAVPAEIYQLEQWRQALSEVGGRHPVVVCVTVPDIGRLVTERTGLDVVLASAGVQLERLVETRRPAAVLYLNHREPNFRMLRYPETVHVYLGHGESDKGASASHQNMAYDYCFVAGPAGRERLEAAMPLFDASRRAPMVGRPNLDPRVLRTGRPGTVPDAPGRTTVLYAPTWEGGLPSMAFGTVASHGEALARAVTADPAYRLVYRPHPLTGTIRPADRAADARVRAVVEAAGSPHVVDTGPYGWQLGAADVAVVDVSSVAYDWLATGKPMLLTVPADPRARPTPSRLLDIAPRLPAGEAAQAVERIREVLEHPVTGWSELVAHHFGDTSPGASVERFLDALDAVIAGPPA